MSRLYRFSEITFETLNKVFKSRFKKQQIFACVNKLTSPYLDYTRLNLQYS